MGLFKRPKPHESPAKVAADLAKQRGDYISYFSLAHKAELDAWEQLITESRAKTKESRDDVQTLGFLRESKSLLDGLHAWCAEREHGEEYFRFAYINGDRSLYNRVMRELEEVEKKIQRQ